MKNLIVGLAAVSVMIMGQLALAAKAIDDKELGLTKTSVFDTPSQQSFDYRDKAPGGGEVLPRAYLNAPPQIPHDISGFTPVTLKNNMCIVCHNRPDLIGKKEKGQPTAIPKSHYTDLRNNPNKVGDTVVGARFVCTQCHVPQAVTNELVGNTFK